MSHLVITPQPGSLPHKRTKISISHQAIKKADYPNHFNQLEPSQEATASIKLKNIPSSLSLSLSPMDTDS